MQSNEGGNLEQITSKQAFQQSRRVVDGSTVPSAYRRTCSTESRAGSTEMKIGLTIRRRDDLDSEFSGD